MKKINIWDFAKHVAGSEVYIPLPLMPIFDENGEAWVMEGTIGEYCAAHDYFEHLAKEMVDKYKLS